MVMKLCTYNSITIMAARNQRKIPLAAGVRLRETIEKIRVAAKAMTMMISKAKMALS